MGFEFHSTIDMKPDRAPTNGLRRERMRASPRFDGRVFRNTYPVSTGLKEGVERPTMRDFLCPDEKRVPSAPLPLVDPVAFWAKRPASGLRVTWLGHSTLLIEIDGVRVLTDPVWSNRASPRPSLARGDFILLRLRWPRSRRSTP
jgi:hypothetical protein